MQITQAQARIPDLSHSTTVVVSADARGPLADMLGVVNSSGLAALTGQVLGEDAGRFTIGPLTEVVAQRHEFGRTDGHAHGSPVRHAER